MITGLAFLEIVVKNFDQALKWYTENLGLIVFGEIESCEDGHWCRFKTNDGCNSVALWQPNWVPNPQKEHPYFMPVLAVTNLYAMVNDLKRKGVVFTEGIRERPSYSITTLVDLEGNQLQLQETKK
ncbi:MAG: VOC family protein [bacterium]